MARPDGSNARFLSPLQGTNNPLPSTGKSITWSPDGKRIAFVTSVPGPETEDANGDPVVITRYLYKPDDSEGFTRFNDNRRVHIFVVDVASAQVRQLTSGTHYEHSIEWSPNADEIVFISNRESNEDQFFNYDIFTLKVSEINAAITSTKAPVPPAMVPDENHRVSSNQTRSYRSRDYDGGHIWLIRRGWRHRRELGARSITANAPAGPRRQAGFTV